MILLIYFFLDTSYWILYSIFHINHAIYFITCHGYEFHNPTCNKYIYLPFYPWIQVLAVSRVMVAWQPIGITMGVYDMCHRYYNQIVFTANLFQIIICLYFSLKQFVNFYIPWLNVSGLVLIRDFFILFSIILIRCLLIESLWI